ncbi:UNVERIFIED_CONTAM: hypothetical protein K2H54_038094 [Gekko kuhli]
MGRRGKEIGRHQGRSQQWRWWRGSRRRRRRWQPLKERGQPVRQQWGEEDEEEPEDADAVGSNASTYAESDNSTVDSMPAGGTKAEHWDCWQSVLQQTGFKPILGILETCTATQWSSWVTGLRVWAFLVSRIDCRFGVEEQLQRPKDNCLWNQLQTTCRHIMETFLWANRADTTTKQPIVNLGIIADDLNREEGKDKLSALACTAPEYWDVNISGLQPHINWKNE